jgi:hypothetical protein
VRKLYRVRWDARFGEEPDREPWLARRMDRDYELVAEVAKAGDTSPAELAQFLDSEAENANYHELVGAYSGLAILLVGLVQVEAAGKIMWIIAQLNGFEGLDGFRWEKLLEDIP